MVWAGRFAAASLLVSSAVPNLITRPPKQGMQIERTSSANHPVDAALEEALSLEWTIFFCQYPPNAVLLYPSKTENRNCSRESYERLSRPPFGVACASEYLLWSS